MEFDFRWSAEGLHMNFTASSAIEKLKQVNPNTHYDLVVTKNIVAAILQSFWILFI